MSKHSSRQQSSNASMLNPAAIAAAMNSMRKNDARNGNTDTDLNNAVSGVDPVRTFNDDGSNSNVSSAQNTTAGEAVKAYTVNVAKGIDVNFTGPDVDEEATIFADAYLALNDLFTDLYNRRSENVSKLDPRNGSNFRPRTYDQSVIFLMRGVANAMETQLTIDAETNTGTKIPSAHSDLQQQKNELLNIINGVSKDGVFNRDSLSGEDQYRHSAAHENIRGAYLRRRLITKIRDEMCSLILALTGQAHQPVAIQRNPQNTQMKDQLAERRARRRG